MRKTNLTRRLAWLAALLCLTLLFAACAATGDDPQSSGTVELTPPVSDVPRDEAADKALILALFSGSGSDGTGISPEKPLEMLQSVALCLGDLTATVDGETGNLSDLIVLKDMAMALNFPGSNPVYLLLTPEGDALSLEYDAENDAYITDVVSLLEAEMDAGLPEELTSALTPPTADQLIHEGDGVYVIADEYFLSYIDLFVDLSAEQAGVTNATQIRAMKATFQSYFEDLNLRCSATVDGGSVTKLSVSAEAAEELLAELLASTGGIDMERVGFKLQMELLLTDNRFTGCTVSAEFGIPSAGSANSETNLYTIEYVSGSLSLHMDTTVLSLPERDVMDASLDMEMNRVPYELDADGNATELTGQTETERLSLSATMATSQDPSVLLYSVEMDAPDGTSMQFEGELLTDSADIPDVSLPANAQEIADRFYDSYLPNRDEIWAIVSSIPSDSEALELAAQAQGPVLVCYLEEYDMYASYFIHGQDLTFDSLSFETQTAPDLRR